jgi:hypothetical protein
MVIAVAFLAIPFATQVGNRACVTRMRTINEQVQTVALLR